MTVVKLKHLKIYTDNRGAERHYFRRKGYPEVALPGEPLSAEYMEAYHAALSGAPKKTRVRYAEGTVAHALTKWYASSKFASNEAQTRANYRWMMERELADYMDYPIKKLEPRHIQGWIDDMADRPGAAKTFLKRLKTFLKFCASPKSGNILTTNPAANVERPQYESAGFLAWDDADAVQYEKRWPLGTKQHLAFAIMTYTGQRVSDAAKMGRQDERGDFVAVTQAKLRRNKKRVKILIPIHPKLREAINACGMDGRMIYLQTQYNRPYSIKGLSQDMSDWAKQAGLAEGKTSHGLRKLAGTRLAEAGCSEKEIMAVLGLSSIQEAKLYTDAANQKHLATAAMTKVNDAERVARRASALANSAKTLNRAPAPVKARKSARHFPEKAN